MHSTKTRTLSIMLALAITGVVAATTAMAHEGTNHGTIKVHDDESVDPARRNQPHVSCGFWIEGFNMADDSGYLKFYAWPPTGDKSEVTPTGANLTWNGTAEADADGFHFNVGPFELPSGHYRVEAYLDQGHPGDEDHFAKTKTFWVNECPEEEAPPSCPLDIVAVAESDGDIHLSWAAVADADWYRIYRGTSAMDLDSLAAVKGNETTFTDASTEVGTTYVYAVTVVVDGQESAIEEDCIVEATAIPVFPGAVAGALAVLGAVGVFAVMSRRRT